MPGPVPIQIGRNSLVAGNQRLSVAAVAVALSVPNDKVVSAYLKLQAGPIFYTLDGTTPSTTNGVEMVDGEAILLNLHEALKFQAIQGASAGILTINFYQTP
jgi:hypothetical protein